MNVSLRWLEDFLRRRLDVKDVTERLAMLGAPVDAVEPLHAGLGDILIGLVEEVRPHPNADRLRVCRGERRNGRAAQRGLWRGERGGGTEVSLRAGRRHASRRPSHREAEAPR